MKAIAIMAAVGLMAATAFAAECGVKTRDGALCRLSDMVVRIDMQDLLKMPVGGTLQGEELWPWNYGLSSVKVPREWSDGAKCDALRVSDVLVDGETMPIRGRNHKGNVQPFAMACRKGGNNG
jgi:hypothetical protein